VDDTPRPTSPVTIRHAWREAGALKTHSVTLRPPGAYTVACEQEPTDEFIEMSLPSGKRS
jgi:hypothetical protein